MSTLTRFDVMVAKADRARGLELLKKLDNAQGASLASLACWAWVVDFMGSF